METDIFRKKRGIGNVVNIRLSFFFLPQLVYKLKTAFDSTEVFFFSHFGVKRLSGLHVCT